MLSAWTQHLKDNPEEKKKFEDYVKSSKLLINRLNGILESLERDLGYSEVKLDTFDNPNWAYLQAYKNGYRGALQKIKQLISVDQEGK